jgi:cold shock CspA family protein
VGQLSESQLTKQEEEEMKDDSDSAYYAGRLHWWNGNSYGFIRPDGRTGSDIFVHRTELPENYAPRVGDRVTYRLATDAKRKGTTHAVGVRVITA